MLWNLLCESEDFIKEPENLTTDRVHQDELNLLHDICDGDIALHDVELAIQVCCDLAYQSRAQLLRRPCEIFLYKGPRQTLLSLEIHDQGVELLNRFDNLGDIND